jgi:hydrogenase nickel incorporation protein HypB
MSERIEVKQNIFSENDAVAAANLKLLRERGIFAVDVLASPGAGKTSLIEGTLLRLRDRFQIAVVNGDLATRIDADRAEQAGAVAVQINTGGGCHLDANMLKGALGKLPLDSLDLLIVENVGNLVCPAAYVLGTQKRVLVASIPEGDDKPYKYPGMYRGVDILIINKMDLLPYVEFDLEYFRKGVQILNPGLRSFPLSCKTGEGFPEWIRWLKNEIQQPQGERVRMG